STYLGGSEADQGNGIALLPSGDILVGGRTWSADFPWAKQKLGPGGKSEVFLARFSRRSPTSPGAVVLGGSNDEKLTGLAVWGKSVLMTGYTESRDFPTARPFQARLKGPSDAFVIELSDSLSTLGFSTYFGGSGDDSGWGISLDPKGNPVVA